MERPPRPRGERLLNRRVLARVYGYVGLLEGLAAMASFFAYLLGGWRPGLPLPDVWPPVVFGAEELRKLVVRRRRP